MHTLLYDEFHLNYNSLTKDVSFESNSIHVRWLVCFLLHRRLHKQEVLEWPEFHMLLVSLHLLRRTLWTRITHKIKFVAPLL